MTDDETPGPPPGSGRLWTEPREEDEHTQWLAPRTPIQPPPDFEPAPTPTGHEPQRRLAPLVLLGVLLACLLFGAGVFGAKVLLDDATTAAKTAALPAAPGAVAPDARARAVRDIYATAGPSVVWIKSEEGNATASGTGFVIDSNGTIVTNSHVVAGSQNVSVRFEKSGKTVPAEVLGTDLSTDLAVLRVDGQHTQKLKPLALADSGRVQVGDLAVAIGYPLGLDQTVTQGIVSAVDGSPIKSPNGFSIDKVIQTDAPINPGNSGGPLLDAAGRVIGINSQIATAAAGGGNVGIGFAVPSNTVRSVVPRLRAGGSIKRPYLGVSTSPSTVGQGAQVADLVPGAPADVGGVRIGDTISRVAGQEIQAPEDISAAIENRRPGDQVEIEVKRAGATQRLQVKLGTRPENVAASPSAGP
jgi:putative serine protease PepD